jgi:hypothetical protein
MLPPPQVSPSRASCHASSPGHEVVAGIDEHRLEPVEPLLLEAERHDSRLGCDRHPHLVGDLEAPAALEPFFFQEDRDPAVQPRRLVGVEPVGLPHALADDLPPGGGKRPLLDRPPATGSQPRQHQGLD